MDSSYPNKKKVIEVVEINLLHSSVIMLGAKC